MLLLVWLARIVRHCCCLGRGACCSACCRPGMNVRLWLQQQGRLLLHLDPHHPLAAPQPHMPCSPNLAPSSLCAACGGARSRRLSAPPPCCPRALRPHLGLPAAAATSQGPRAAASTRRHPRPRRGAPEPPAQRRQLCVPPHHHLHQASRPPGLLQRSQGLQAARIAYSLLGAGPPTLRQVCV